MNDDDDRTPSEGIRIISDGALALANLGLAMEQAALDCREASVLVDGCEGTDERLSALEEKLGELAELCHEARQAVRAGRTANGGIHGGSQG